MGGEGLNFQSTPCAQPGLGALVRHLGRYLVVATPQPNLVGKQALFGCGTCSRQTPSQSLNGVSAGSTTLWDVDDRTPHSELDFVDVKTVIEMRRSRQFKNRLPNHRNRLGFPEIWHVCPPWVAAALRSPPPCHTILGIPGDALGRTPGRGSPGIPKMLVWSA